MSDHGEYGKAALVREIIRLSAQDLFPNEYLAFDFMWESVWEVTGATQIEDFSDINDWSFEPDPIEAGGIGGGAFSQDTVPAIVCLLHACTTLATESNDSEFSLPHMESLINRTAEQLGVSERVRAILKEDGAYIIERIDKALQELVAEDIEATVSDSSDASKCWCTWLIPGSVVEHEKAMDEEAVAAILDGNEFDIVIDEPRGTVHVRHESSSSSASEYAIDGLSSNVSGMLWLLLTRSMHGCISDDDFQIVRTKEKYLARRKIYTNFTELFQQWAGKKIAGNWHGIHVSAGVPVHRGSLGYCWVRQYRDAHRSHLIAKCYNYREA